MGALTGINSMINYAGAANDAARVNLLLAAIPNPDTTSSDGAIQGIIGFLDEMSPACAAQLRVELAALAASVT